MNYKIYQVKSELIREFGFMDLSFIVKKYGKVDKNNYDLVYEEKAVSDFSDLQLLEKLFTQFNVNHPENYKVRSLSVSDIVILDNSKVYYCDSIGWEILDNKDWI
jgi:hypothetical protein